MNNARRICIWLVCVVLSAGCASRHASPSTPSAQAGRTVVVWISVDGLRHDYVQRYHPPLLSRLAREGAFTTQLVPVFPSLTFPSHCSEATGVTTDRHGVTMNAFYDATSHQQLNMPADSRWLQAEPIWITASRQHVRTAVFDWPLSYVQTGPVRSDYFAEDYSKDWDDLQRLENVLSIWRHDSASEPREPLRLVMAYVSHLDSVGHKYGPDSPEVGETLVEMDALLDSFLQQAIEMFDERMTRDDELYVLITTDHGMSPVHTQVNLERLLGWTCAERLRIVTSGSVAHVWLDRLPPYERGARRETVLARLKQYKFVDAWTREGVPKEWRYDHPTRVGDIVVSLKRGYTFTSKRDAPTKPVVEGASHGMHGYPPSDNPDMMGFAVLWRYRKPLGGSDLGRVDSLQIHPTVANILGIAPAPGATGKVIPIGIAK